MYWLLTNLTFVRKCLLFQETCMYPKYILWAGSREIFNFKHFNCGNYTKGPGKEDDVLIR